MFRSFNLEGFTYAVTVAFLTYCRTINVKDKTGTRQYTRPFWVHLLKFTLDTQNGFIDALFGVTGMIHVVKSQCTSQRATAWQFSCSDYVTLWSAVFTKAWMTCQSVVYTFQRRKNPLRFSNNIWLKRQNTSYWISILNKYLVTSIKRQKYDIRSNSRSEGKGKTLTVEDWREGRVFFSRKDFSTRTARGDKPALKLSPVGRG